MLSTTHSHHWLYVIARDPQMVERRCHGKHGCGTRETMTIDTAMQLEGIADLGLTALVAHCMAIRDANLARA